MTTDEVLPNAAGDEPDELEASIGAPVGRRLVLTMTAMAAVGVAFGASLQRGLDQLLAPIRAVDPTGLTSLVPGAGGWRYYSVTARQPQISVNDYRLELTGLVNVPTSLTYRDLSDMPQVQWTRDFQCVTGWRVQDAQWQGVTLRDLLDAAGIRAGASAVSFTSHDGLYSESLTLEQVMTEEVLIATHLDGETLTQSHGGPVRLVVIPMYGYKSLKWLSGIEVVQEVQPGYWEQRGYDVDAFIGQSNGRNDEPV